MAMTDPVHERLHQGPLIEAPEGPRVDPPAGQPGPLHEDDRQARQRAMDALFAWIDAQPPVPHMSFDAFDREDIY